MLLALAIGSGIIWAQSSPSYEISNAGVVATAGSASSPEYQATVTGGEGAPAQSASSPQYAVIIGAGDPNPVNADAVFASGFEG